MLIIESMKLLNKWKQLEIKCDKRVLAYLGQRKIDCFNYTLIIKSMEVIRNKIWQNWNAFRPIWVKEKLIVSITR